MDGLTRRRLLGGAAAAAGGLGLGLLPLSMQKALAATPEKTGSLADVKHVVFIPQENRTFDHYFGTLSGVRGFDDPTAITLPTGRSVFYQPDPDNPDGYELPFHLDTRTTSAAAPSFDTIGLWSGPQKLWDNGQMDRFVSHPVVDDGLTYTLTMGYYTRDDIPFHFALADEFTICDNYFTSVLGESNPNHLMMFAGTIDPDGTHGGPILNNDFPHGPLTLTAYFERLQAAGISWKYYHSPNGVDEPLQAYFQSFANAAPGSPLYENGVQEHLLSEFRDDVLNDRLAQFSRVSPSAAGLPDASEHMPALPAQGAVFMYDVLDALASNPDVWAKTVVFITYDDFGGWFDHVPPPTAPEGTPGEWLTVNPLPAEANGFAGPIGLGFRVPMLVISPWSRGGWVASETFDHTSVIRFCERLFGVHEPQISAWRRATVGDLTSALRFKNPDDKPLAKTLSKLPDPTALVALEEQEVATLPIPEVSAVQTMPHQEPGSRPHTHRPPAG